MGASERRRARARSRTRRATAGSRAVLVGGVVAVMVIAALGLRLAMRTPSLGQATPGQAGVATHLALEARAPGGSFATTSGRTRNVASLRGKPTLLWFVATWCSSCQAGTTAMAREMPEFARLGVRVVELELYRDLGQPGPGIATFVRAEAGPRALADPGWMFGMASASLTRTYDPWGYLDVYYLLDRAGRIRDVGSSPAGTMGTLLRAVRGLG